MVAAIFFGKYRFSNSPRRVSLTRLLGRGAFTYHHYSWIAILINIPATVFATGFYELLMRDSLQKIGKGHAVHADGDDGLALHLTKTGIPTARADADYLERGYVNQADNK